MFPLADHRGRVLGFGARVMGEGRGPKYLNTSENALFHKGRQLFGIDIARPHVAKSGRIVVGRGLHRRARAAPGGDPRGRRDHGHALTPEQLALLGQATPARSSWRSTPTARGRRRWCAPARGGARRRLHRGRDARGQRPGGPDRHRGRGGVRGAPGRLQSRCSGFSCAGYLPMQTSTRRPAGTRHRGGKGSDRRHARTFRTADRARSAKSRIGFGVPESYVDARTGDRTSTARVAGAGRRAPTAAALDAGLWMAIPGRMSPSRARVAELRWTRSARERRACRVSCGPSARSSRCASPAASSAATYLCGSATSTCPRPLAARVR